jgi:RHS repeat-associated protein
MEKDDELKSEGNSYDFGSRMLDPRVGRWFAPDPMEFKFPDMSPYAYANNNPIYFVDRDGEEPTPAAYKRAAEKLGVSVALIRAVYKTEVGAGAYLSNGKIKILYERHYFHDRTKGKYDLSHPKISNKNPYKPKEYGSKTMQYSKLAEAASLDKEAAYASVSWGGFQIMGANYKAAGYDNATKLGEAMINGDEDTHLEAFVNYVSSHKSMLKALKSKNWALFASKYNGPNYKKYNYDVNMESNYNKIKDNPLIEKGIPIEQKENKPIMLQEVIIELERDECGKMHNKNYAPDSNSNSSESSDSPPAEVSRSARYY